MGSRIELLSKKGLSLAQSLHFSCQPPYFCSKTGWHRVENWPMSNHRLYVPQHMDQCPPQQCPVPTILPVWTPTCACLWLQSLKPFICPDTNSVPNLHLLSGAAGQPLLISTSSHPHPQTDQAFLQGTCPPASLWWREWWAGCLWWAQDVSTTMLHWNPALEAIWTCGISTARPGFTSYCCNSSGVWPWANKVSFPPLSLPAYLSCLIR